MNQSGNGQSQSEQSNLNQEAVSPATPLQALVRRCRGPSKFILSGAFTPSPQFGIETLYGGSRPKSALVQSQVLPMDLNRVPSRSTTIQFVSIVESHITQGIETNDAGEDIISKRIIDDVVIRRIFINATAERAIDTRVRVIMSGLSRLKSTEIDLILARGAVGACFSWRLLEIAAGPIIEKKQLIARHGHSMLADRR